MSTAPFANKQTFTSSGTFTVPAGVTMLAVMCIGGGGGGGGDGGEPPSTGGSGGTTSFGSYLIAYGGAGGCSGGYQPYTASVGSVLFDGSAGVIASGGGWALVSGVTWGKGGNGTPYGGMGGPGGSILGLVPVTPGSVITVTVGSGGGSYGGAASAGACVVRY